MKLQKRGMCLVLCLILTVLQTFTLSGCGKKAGNTVNEPANTTPPAQVAETENKSKEENLHEGEFQSTISGLWLPEKLEGKRPYAIMINNIEVASRNQSGTSQASIIYEAVVEGGITRMMGIYEDFDSDRIGSTRSARHYFVSFADEYDAIYCHYGQTKYALKKISELGVDNLSGLSSEGETVYYRDNSLKAPHNAFASYDGIKKGTKLKGYRTKLRKNVTTHYKFYEEDTDLDGEIQADKVTLKFSGYTSPYFSYNKKKKLYYRYEFDKKHVDTQTGKQLKFKNLIIQYVNEWTLDDKGYQTMDIENSSGKGYYITNGTATKITWEKNEKKKSMHYRTEDGKLLTVNPGKTYIAIFPDRSSSEVTFSKE
ncbi:MAG: DUF3048 domain-containing protein [Clostridiales bacterium]|nr:DUF3048 domain-containing protein [Clostridiales bacterium]